MCHCLVTRTFSLCFGFWVDGGRLWHIVSPFGLLLLPVLLWSLLSDFISVETLTTSLHITTVRGKKLLGFQVDGGRPYLYELLQSGIKLVSWFIYETIRNVWLEVSTIFFLFLGALCRKTVFLIYAQLLVDTLDTQGNKWEVFDLSKLTNDAFSLRLLFVKKNKIWNLILQRQSESELCLFQRDFTIRIIA